MLESERALRLDTREIKRLRIEKGWNQERLAAEVRVTKKTIERWESGRPVYTRNIATLAEKLGVSPIQLCGQPRGKKVNDDRARAQLHHDVQKIWIDGVLRNSLQGLSAIALSLQRTLGDTSHPCDYQLPQASNSSQQASSNAIADVFCQTEGEMLILGKPGAGKTTLLLQLASVLLDKARSNYKQPVPVIFNLASWVSRGSPFDTWLVEELHQRYEVSSRLGCQWIEEGRIVPLLDGLDEISVDKRCDCVEAINEFREAQRVRHQIVPMVVCVREKNYENLPVRLALKGAVIVKPLTRDQVTDYLQRGGKRLAGLRDTLLADPRLWGLLDTPLMLAVLARV